MFCSTTLKMGRPPIFLDMTLVWWMVSSVLASTLSMSSSDHSMELNPPTLFLWFS